MRDSLGSNLGDTSTLKLLRRFRQWLGWEPPPFQYSGAGELSRIRPHLEALLTNPKNLATLIIQAVDGEEFVQFTGGIGGVEMDFPLITEPQRAREAAIRRFITEHGHRVRVTFGSDGSQFLDIDLPADASMIAKLTERVFTDLFGLSSSITLRFTGEGFTVAA